MTDSWRTTLAKLSAIAQDRELTENEMRRWNDALRKRAREISKRTDGGTS